jgi:hypothetical protein
MQTAIFGISNDGLNLVANLFVMALVIVWLALIVWTYLDARRRIEDPVLITCATAASLFPYIGTFVYSILRPPEFLEDAKERQLEIKAAELRVRQLSELTCSNCGFPVEKTYLRCPNCQRRLKDPCQTCGKPVDPRWALCPYCESPLPGRQQARRSQPPPREAPAGERRAPAREPASAPQRRSSGTRRARPKAKPEKAPASRTAEDAPKAQHPDEAPKVQQPDEAPKAQPPEQAPRTQKRSGTRKAAASRSGSSRSGGSRSRRPRKGAASEKSAGGSTEAGSDDRSSAETAEQPSAGKSE